VALLRASQSEFRRFGFLTWWVNTAGVLRSEVRLPCSRTRTEALEFQYPTAMSLTASNYRRSQGPASPAIWRSSRYSSATSSL
jgi:hypothetical protein